MAGESKQTYTVDDIKSELRIAVRQLGELARSNTDFDEFCNALLAKLVKLTGSHGAVLWQANPHGVCQITHRDVSAELRLDISDSMHRDVVKEVIQTGQPICIESENLVEEGYNVDPQAAQCLLLIAPVVNRKKENCGTLELLQRRNISDPARDGYLKFLGRIAELFQRWHEHHDLQRLSQTADRHSSTMDFVTQVHKSIDYKETAFAIANEARRVLSCDRVSVAKWNGNACKVVAVSSQDRFDNRANVIRKLGSLATACVSGKMPIWITGDTEGLPPEIVRRLNDYTDEAHSRTISVIPIEKRPDEQAELEFKPSERKKPQKLGALIIEYFDRDVTRDQVSDSVQLITHHSELAVANAREHNQIFLRPLWKRLGLVQEFLFRDHYTKTMAALAVLGLLALYMLFVPSELEMRCSGVAQPRIRRHIFSQTDGVVNSVNADHGDKVTAGQVLIELANPDLEMGITDARVRMAVAENEIDEAKRQMSRISEMPRAEAISLMGRESQLNSQKKSCLLYTSPSPRDQRGSRMPSSA